MSLSSSCMPAAPTSTLARDIPSHSGVMPVLMLAALYAIPIVTTLRPVNDLDIWWHLRAGQWVCEHHAVPLTDPFSRWGADKAWIAYSWLFEVLVYRLYEAFGLAGIVVYRLVMSLAVAAALHRLVRRRQPFLLGPTTLTAAAVLALTPLFTERPWLFTVLFSILTLDVLLDLRDGRAGWSVWLLPLVYALWANLHIQFVYGLFLLALACLPDPCWRCGLAKRWLLAGLCLLATLVNPYYIRLYGVVWELATQSGPLRYVSEMHALEFRGAADWVVLLFGAAAMFALGRRQRVSRFEVLLLFSAGFFAFRSQRDLWFLVLAAAAILAGQPLPLQAKAQTPPRCWAAATVLLAGLVALLSWQRGLSEENLRRKVAELFPVEAAAVLAQKGHSGPLFNDYDWGGFLIWTLPQLPVILDGRANLHGDERVLRLGNTWSVGPGWRDDPDLESAGIVLANARCPLGCVLMLDDRFQLVHEDTVARVFVRKRPATPTYQPSIRSHDGRVNAHREQAGGP
jgi:hypothetical protein